MNELESLNKKEDQSVDKPPSDTVDLAYKIYDLAKTIVLTQLPQYESATSKDLCTLNAYLMNAKRICRLLFAADKSIDKSKESLEANSLIHRINYLSTRIGMLASQKLEASLINVNAARNFIDNVATQSEKLAAIKKLAAGCNENCSSIRAFLTSVVRQDLPISILFTPWENYLSDLIALAKKYSVGFDQKTISEITALRNEVAQHLPVALHKLSDFDAQKQDLYVDFLLAEIDGNKPEKEQALFTHLNMFGSLLCEEIDKACKGKEESLSAEVIDGYYSKIESVYINIDGTEVDPAYKKLQETFSPFKQKVTRYTRRQSKRLFRTHPESSRESLVSLLSQEQFMRNFLIGVYALTVKMQNEYIKTVNLIYFDVRSAHYAKIATQYKGISSKLIGKQNRYIIDMSNVKYIEENGNKVPDLSLLETIRLIEEITQFQQLGLCDVGALANSVNRVTSKAA